MKWLLWFATLLSATTLCALLLSLIYTDWQIEMLCQLIEWLDDWGEEK